MENKEFKILQLAPHPFYIERGTPIDVELVLRVLSERENTSVDVLVYHLGKDINIPNVKIHRIPYLKFIRDIRPGFSIKKLICSSFLFFKAWSLLKNNKYDLIHAGEESVFFAMFFKKIFKIPYVYDLDSSIAQQIVEKKLYLKSLSLFFDILETKAIKGAIANLPVCNALAELCEKGGSKKTVTIHDISQLKNPGAKSKGSLKKEIGTNKKILLYAGNLEVYQGIELLLKSFKIVCEKTDDLVLVIIGGMKEDITYYKKEADILEISNRVYFLGQKPFDELEYYLTEADIIACPRIKGVNTPMKIFPFLHSGKPVIATDLYTHTQILSNGEALLAAPTPKDFAKGIIQLVNDENLCKKLGENGMTFIEKNHTYKAHKERLLDVYDWIEHVGLQEWAAKNNAYSAKALLFVLCHPIIYQTLDSEFIVNLF
ncbi:MAG: hypothetical protein A2057_17615 [Ignavibacteria bacterium GWA2_35_9]|nr:MAG: hypothetical protein A2057_17615 [Ignavibacteria bacterium GWA2_35_9]OGU47937.1 MAG: hypothetical protein A2000_08055 [Ignavibacteria bacterium GWB2_36_8]OGU49784.1 MAG: hypothetical protein A2080_03980 [Ignavibacteria bacterium GWC2_36_12]